MGFRASSVLSLVSVGLLVAACGGSDGGSAVGGEGATAGAGGSAAGSGGDAGSGNAGSGNAGSGGQAGSAGAGGDAGSGNAGSAAGGSAGNGGSAGAASGGTGGVEEDTTPPRIIDALPADGEAGVREDAKIVITFSEPMDQAATETAYESPDISAGEVTMEWNAAGDVLTITPNAPLPYANAGDRAVAALEFAYKINTSATDLAGNPLAADPEYHFTTARRCTRALEPVASLTGLVSSNGYDATNDIIVGDGSANQEYRGFLTLDMSKLPDGILEFESAKLHVDQESITGTPYLSLGSVQLHEADFATLDMTAFNAASLNNLGVLASEKRLDTKSVDVVRTLAADYSQRTSLGDLSQFRLQFSTPISFDSAADNAHFDLTTLGMDVTYLAE